MAFTCTRCGVAKEAAKFPPDAGGKRGFGAQCKACCAEKTRTWYSKNKARAAESRRRYYALHKEDCLTKSKAWRGRNKEHVCALGKRRYQANKEQWVVNKLRNVYSLEYAEYEFMLTQQAGACAICGGVNKNGHRLAVDHNHVTGAIRSLLCGNCNSMLGHAKELPSVLRKAAAYLEKHCV